MNAHDRRITRRLCARYGVEVAYQHGTWRPWAVFVNGEPVTEIVRYTRYHRCFNTKAAAIRCGAAHAKRLP